MLTVAVKGFSGSEIEKKSPVNRTANNAQQPSAALVNNPRNRNLFLINPNMISIPHNNNKP